MFMGLFKEENLPDLNNAAAVDCSQYDSADIFNIDGISAEDAGKELLKTDASVDYMRNWGIIKKMMADDNFKDQVIKSIDMSS